MGLFSWFKRKPKPKVSITMEYRGKRFSDPRYPLDIVGESNYKKNFRKICGRPNEEGENKEIKALLILEDNNKHDSNAVRVDIKNLTVGYLRKTDAVQYRSMLAKSENAKSLMTCDAIIRGGWKRKDGDEGDYGVWLSLNLK